MEKSWEPVRKEKGHRKSQKTKHTRLHVVPMTHWNSLHGYLHCTVCQDQLPARIRCRRRRRRRCRRRRRRVAARARCACGRNAGRKGEGPVGAERRAELWRHWGGWEAAVGCPEQQEGAPVAVGSSCDSGTLNS